MASAIYPGGDVCASCQLRLRNILVYGQSRCDVATVGLAGKTEKVLCLALMSVSPGNVLLICGYSNARLLRNAPG
jgi:hypothetical protein